MGCYDNTDSPLSLFPQPSSPRATLEVDTKSCTVSWPGCREVYNGVHTCDRTKRHDGRHRCVCGATKARKK